MKKFTIFFAMAVLLTQVSFAADLKQLAEQLVNLTVKEMPVMAPHKDDLKPKILEALGKDAKLREAVENFLQSGTLEPQARAALMQIVAQVQAQAVGAAPARQAARAGNGQDLSWADFDEFGKKTKDSNSRGEQANMWHNAKAISNDGLTIVGAGYKDSVRAGRNPQTGKEIKTRAGIVDDSDGKPRAGSPKNPDIVNRVNTVPGMGNSTFPRDGREAEMRHRDDKPLPGGAIPTNPEMREGRGVPQMGNSTFPTDGREARKPADPVPGFDIPWSGAKGAKMKMNPQEIEQLTEQVKERIKTEINQSGGALDTLGDASVALIANKLVRNAWQVEEVKVEKEGDAPKVKVKAKRVLKKKLFGFIPVTVEEIAEIDADMEKVKRPWWSFLAW